MTARTAFLTAAMTACCLSLPAPSAAAPLRTSFAHCEDAIVAELGDGRVRQDLLTAHKADDGGRHWINVRFRAVGEDQTAKYRAYCETAADGAVASLTLDSGRWKKSRSNRAPKAVSE